VKYWIITKVTKVKYLPNFARTHIKRLIDQRAIDIMLYKRPGRARAYLRMQEDERTGDFIYTACNGCRYSMNINASLSEDAHILRFLSNDHERNWHILSFTW